MPEDELLEPWVATFLLPSLMGRAYLFLGERRDVHVRRVLLTEERAAYDLYMPADAVDRADLERRHPEAAAKPAGDWYYTRVGWRVLQRAGLASNPQADAPPGLPADRAVYLP